MVPDYFQPLTGWRKFGVREGGGVLVSANYPQPWHSAEAPAAVCIAERGGYDVLTMTVTDRAAHPEPAPALKCHCGYYAYKARNDAAQHQQGSVLARVELWGRVVIHARGYRAERLKIAELFIPHDYPAREALAARYGVPLTEDSSWTWASRNASSSSNPYQSPFQIGSTVTILPPTRYQPIPPPSYPPYQLYQVPTSPAAQQLQASALHLSALQNVAAAMSPSKTFAEFCAADRAKAAEGKILTEFAKRTGRILGL